MCADPWHPFAVACTLPQRPGQIPRAIGSRANVPSLLEQPRAIVASQRGLRRALRAWLCVRCRSPMTPDLGGRCPKWAFRRVARIPAYSCPLACPSRLRTCPMSLKALAHTVACSAVRQAMGRHGRLPPAGSTQEGSTCPSVLAGERSEVCSSQLGASINLGGRWDGDGDGIEPFFRQSLVGA